MLQKPETYEEAVKIIYDSVEREDLIKRNNKIYLLRTKLITGIGFAVGIVAAIITADPVVIGLVLPFIGLAALDSLIPYFVYNRNIKKVKNGTFFNNMTEKEIMDNATTYVESYNDLKSRGLIK